VSAEAGVYATFHEFGPTMLPAASVKSVLSLYGLTVVLSAFFAVLPV
jgi:hypothetical protein